MYISSVCFQSMSKNNSQLPLVKKVLILLWSLTLITTAALGQNEAVISHNIKTGIMCAKGNHSWVFINTLDQHLYQCSIGIPVNTQLTLPQHMIDSLSIISQLICINWKIGTWWSAGGADGVLTKHQLRCQWSANQGSAVAINRHPIAAPFCTDDP